jgi:preprotein translocase subunit SecA
MREVERAVLLRVIDMLWMEHIDAMMRLRESIGLRGYAQRDPLSEYKQEAYDMYQRLLTAAAEDFIRLIYRVQIASAPKPAVQEGEAIMNNPQIEPGFKEEAREIKAEPGVLPWPRDIDPSKVGRNDPCPCGSGLKFKKCHGR